MSLITRQDLAPLLKALEVHFPDRRFSALIGMSKDKDVRKCLSMLAEKASHLYLVPSPSFKAIGVEEMGQILRQDGFFHFTAGSIQEMIREALASEELLVVCGSFYIMKEAREEVLRIGHVSHDELLLSRR